MNKNQRNGLFAVLTVVSMAAVATLAVYANKGETALNPVQATDNSVEISGEDFAKIPLSDIEISGGTNKTFRYSLGGEKYVDGWILYSDCGHQRIDTIGSTRYFVLDNSEQGRSNNFNFNLIFNFHGVTKTIFEYSYELTGAGSSIHAMFVGAKYSTMGADGFNPYDCDDIHEITNFDEEEGGSEEDGDYYFYPCIWDDAPYDYWDSTLGATGSGLFESTPVHSGDNLCAFQFNAYNVPAHATLKVWLTSMTFTYAC